MVRRIRSTLALALLFLAILVPVARAGEAPAVGDWDLGLQTGYLFGVTNNAQAVTFHPRAGKILWRSEADDPGVVSMGIEGIFTHFFETNSAMELGGGPYIRYRWVRPYVQPYADVAVGMLYNDLKHFSLGSRILFAVSGAVGVQIPVTDGVGLTAGYRFRHISNAGQNAINPGLNANIIVTGLTVTY